jgi:predicted TIM-barrel fold metal-dependent hydrolase
VVLRTIDLFGVDRAMFASNFPVDSLVATFDTIYAGFKAIVRDFPLADRRRLFHDNAVQLYRLDTQGQWPSQVGPPGMASMP